jgi:hypothetical protein
MAQDWRVHALVYFCGAVDDLLGAVLYWNLDLELANMITNMNYTFTAPPSPVGGYRLGDEANGGWIIFNLQKKPRWIHRMGVRLVLGWKWVDA